MFIKHNLAPNTPPSTADKDGWSCVIAFVFDLIRPQGESAAQCQPSSASARIVTDKIGLLFHMPATSSMAHENKTDEFT